MKSNQIKNYINETLNQLTKNVNSKLFENQFKKNIEQKKRSASSESQFFIQLLLNIDYFKANKQAWEKVFRETFSNKKLSKVSYIENELLAEQMRIRQRLHEQRNEYIKKIQLLLSESNSANVLEQLIKEYVQVSIEHSLRIDLLTILSMNEQSTVLFDENFEELKEYLDNRINEQVEQISSKLNLF